MDLRLSDVHPVGPQASDSPQQSCSFQSNCSGPPGGFVSFFSPTLSLFFSRSLSSSVSTQAARVSRCAEGKTQAARVWCAESEQSNPGCTGLVCRKRAKQPRLHGFGVQKASKATQAARVWCAESEQSNPDCTGLVCRKRAKQPRLHGFGVQKASKATQAARVWCAESEQSNPGRTGTVCGA